MSASSSSSSSSSLLGAWRWYQFQLERRPVRTQAAASGVLWASGDAMAQCVGLYAQQRASPTRKRLSVWIGGEDAQRKAFRCKLFQIDWKAVFTSCMFGVVYVGPVGHFWYGLLDSVVKSRLKLQPCSLQFISAKVAADSIIFGPIHLLTFFTFMGFASGKTSEQVKGMIQRDFIPAFIIEGAVWPLVQLLNFSLKTLVLGLLLLMLLKTCLFLKTHTCFFSVDGEPVIVDEDPLC